MLWQPRSILQLLLLGFVTVVAPLGVAVVLSVQALVDQAHRGAELNQQTITLTRTTQQLQSDLLDLERRSRQYATLQERELLRLVLADIDAIQARVESLLTWLEGEGAQTCLELRTRLQRVRQALLLAEGDPPQLSAALAMFDRISSTAAELEQQSRAQVDRDLAGQLDAAGQLRGRILLLASALALLTLWMVTLFSYWINRPIQQLERVIRGLGSARAPEQIEIDGPREMRLLGGQLSWLRDHLVQLDQQKQQFLRHISHELKTPLASLREGADLLAEGVVGPPLAVEQQEVVAILQHNSRELQRLIENLLDYNQLMQRDDVRRVYVELRPLVRELLRNQQLMLQRQRLEPRLELSRECWWLDPGKTRAALDNLISNAISYAEPGSDLLIRSYRRQEWMVIEVANRGTPIGEDEAQRIFEPFFQGRAARQGALKGSGIGLAVARECVQAQGGVLQLVNCRDYAVCFRITLPEEESSS